MGKERINKKVLYLSELAILVAIILLMAFTPIGYIKTAGVEITLITIPVIVGGIILGPAAGAILGGLFGLTSFLQAVMGLSAFGTALMAISPWRTFVVCFPTRLLMGWCTALVFKPFKKKNFGAYSITSLCGSLFNTLFFMAGLLLCFWNSTYIQQLADTLHAGSILTFTVLFVGINGAIEAVCCFAIAGAVSMAVDHYINRARLSVSTTASRKPSKKEVPEKKKSELKEPENKK